MSLHSVSFEMFDEDSKFHVTSSRFNIFDKHGRLNSISLDDYARLHSSATEKPDRKFKLWKIIFPAFNILIVDFYFRPE
jgi:hypothetical protein